MKSCRYLNSELVFWANKVGFCCYRDQVPLLARSEFSHEKLTDLRHDLIVSLNDTNVEVSSYKEFGIPILNSELAGKHPCHGCPNIIDIEDEEVEKSLDTWQVKNLTLIAPNGCNAKCDYCAIYKEDVEFPAYDPEQVFIPINSAAPIKDNVSLVDELFDINLIDKSTSYVFSGGEPSTHKKTMSILSQVSANGAKSLVLTNAIKFAPEIENALKKGNCKVIVDLDSGDRDSYTLIKGVDKFDIVLENLSRYINACDGLNGSFVEMKYILYSKNNSLELIDKYIQIAVDLGATDMCVALNYFEGDGKESPIEKSTIKAMGYFIYQLYLHKFKRIRLDRVPPSLMPQIEDAIYQAAMRSNTSGIQNDDESPLREKVKGLMMKIVPLDMLKQELSKMLIYLSEQGKKVALYGAGEFGHMVLALMRENNIKAEVVFDKKAGESTQLLNDIPVSSISQHDHIAYDAIFICSSLYHEEIYQELKSNLQLKHKEIIDPFVWRELEIG